MRRLSQFLAALAAVGSIVACGERPEVAYANLEAARADGAIARGWIPSWLPESAVDLREIHDLDTGESMLAYSYDPREPPDFDAVCERTRSQKPPRAPFRMSWWPDRLKTGGDGRYELFLCPSKMYLAVDAVAGEAYHWRP